VLFAFLLVVPFQSTFDELVEVQRWLYVAALLASAAATALLIAPSSYHRMNFRRPIKERMIYLSNRLVLGGLLCTAIGVALSVALIVDVALGAAPALVAALVTGAWFLWLWFLIPLWARRDGDGAGSR
jgi:hypothetical protein